MRTGRPLHVIGDSSYKSQRQREVWHSRTPEQQAAWIAGMQAGLPRVRTDEHIRKIAQAQRESWRLKRETGTPGERECLTCGEMYLPTDWRQYYCSHEHRRLYRVLRRYGLTYQQYINMLKRQNGVCAICRGPWKGWNTQNAQPHIDHCHKTGRVRGLLCGDCNTALGRFGDDPVLLRRAADYLDAAL